MLFTVKFNTNHFKSVGIVFGFIKLCCDFMMHIVQIVLWIKNANWSVNQQTDSKKIISKKILWVYLESGILIAVTALDVVACTPVKGQKQWFRLFHTARNEKQRNDTMPSTLATILCSSVSHSRCPINIVAGVWLT